MFSATSWPGIVALLYNWYTPSELALRLAIFNMSDVAGGMFLGLAQAELHKSLDGVHGIAGWSWLFIVAGSITLLLGISGFLIIPDSPSNTRALWISKNERELAREKMSRSGTETAKLIPWAVLRSKLRQLTLQPFTYMYLAAFCQFAWSNRANAYFLLYLKDVADPAGNKLYSTYQVNVIPLGGYAFTIVASIVYSAVSDWKQWRWQMYIFITSIHVVSTAVLAAWPNSHATIMAFYFLTFMTEAAFPILISWLGDILRKEPEARAIVVGASVTIVYIGHATIPLRAWRVADSPTYPIGFPLAASFMTCSILVVLSIVLYLRKNPDLLEHGFDKRSREVETPIEVELAQIKAKEAWNDSSLIKLGYIDKARRS